MSKRPELVGRAANALVALLASGAALAGDPSVQPVREVLLPRVVTGFHRVKFSAGHLLIARLSDEWSGGMTAPADYRLEVLDRDGNTVLLRTPGAEVQDATWLLVHDVALAPDGILVVAMRATGPADRWRAAFLVKYDIRSGALLGRVRTDPLTCLDLATEGTSIWCLGFGYWGRESDPPLIYRFSIPGELLDTRFAVSELAGELREVVEEIEQGEAAAARM